MQSKIVDTHVFYKVQFSVRLKDISTSDYFEELLFAIKRWLVGKYGSRSVSGKIPEWSDVRTGGKWGDDVAFGSFGIESASADNTDPANAPWACKVIEGPVTYTQRKWVTEIGYQPLSEKSIEICYMVTYCDLVKTNRPSVPSPNTPNVAKYLLLPNEKWTCSEPYDAKFLKIEDCRKMAETQMANRNTLEEDRLPMDKHWISLCKVNRLDRNRDIWLLRLADASEGSLTAPVFDDNREQIFDNRRLIFREDGPTTADFLGFWEWKERKSDSGRWWSDATYMEETKPVEIFILGKHTSPGQIVDTLKAGLHIPSYLSGTVLFAIQKNGLIAGLLCDLSDFNIRPGQSLFATLKDSIYTLPYYELNEADVFVWNDRKIYKHITLGEAKQRLPIHIPVQMLKQLFLQKMTWPVFKAQWITKGDWQKIKQFFSELPDTTILETLSQTYGLSAQEAQSCVDAFLHTIEAHMNVEDVDSTLVVQMLDHHEGLKQACYGVAEKKWHEEHLSEVEQARAEITKMRSDAEQDVLKSKHTLEGIEKDITAAKSKHDAILCEISTSQTNLDRIMSDIEQYEALGNDTMEAVRQKISEAQKDMAGFLADISVFLPQQQTVVMSDSETSSWKYVCAVNDCYADKDADEAETYHDEVNSISQNLTNCLRVDSAFSNMLSAFLYAAHINQAPVMIAGPAGCDLAEIISASLYGNGAGQIMLGDVYDSDIVKNIKGHSESIVSVQNMFGKGWNDGYPQMFAKLDKQVIWTHPYVEDLAIEPKGLYNYMLPILSECFVGMLPADEPWPGKRAEKFKPYVSKKQSPLRISAFKKLGLSKLLMNRLTQVLSDAKVVLNCSANEKDMEVLFGLLPLCVLTGRTDILKEVIESENNISATVKTEAKRYIEEV